MSRTHPANPVDESQLIAQLLRKKIITEGQLKAALDFQNSVGGDILQILYNLGLVRSVSIEEILSDGEKSDTGGAEEGGAEESFQKLNPLEVRLEDLKLHHKLLDKLPRELVDEYVIALFFPLPDACSRKLIVGHGRDAPDEVFQRVRELLGVEVCSLALGEDTARMFLDEHQARSRPRHSTPVVEEPRARPPAVVPREGQPEPGPDQEVLDALVGLLVKKGVITREELQVETDLTVRRPG